MARTRTNARTKFLPRRVVVVSLLVQNPTALKPKETTAEPAPGVRTRARRRRAAVTAAALPEEILVWEIFVRLPAKDILRFRAVCRYWRGLTSTPDFLLAHHRRQPSLLLLTLKFSTPPIQHPPYDKVNTDRIFKRAYDKVSTDPIFERGHLLTLYGTASTNPIMESDFSSPGFKIHASCNGLLLLCLSDGCFSIGNPATHQCAPLPCLTVVGRINIAALYLHHPSGKYHVLYWKGRDQDHHKGAYYILMVQPGSLPRCIGVPSDKPVSEKGMLDLNETTTTNLAPPVVFRNCLHWDPSCLRSKTGILVFDTVVESFRLMRCPASSATTSDNRLCTTSDSRLCDMDGSIGFSCFDGWRPVLKIWVLEDYESEVWSFKYHVKFPMLRLTTSSHTQHLVLSEKGDVLVYAPSLRYVYHCDKTGKLIEEFRLNSWSKRIIGPWFKESLVKHDFYLDNGDDK